jgi:sporulation protein YqfC
VIKKDRVKRKVADLFDFPQDVVLDLPRVTLIGNIQLYIENHKGITLYEKNKIRISVTNGELVVDGEDLHLRTVYNDDIYIEGSIKNISLEGCIR